MLIVKIDNFIPNIFSNDEWNHLFKKGNLVKGIILEITDNKIIFEIKGHEIMHGELSQPIELDIGEEVSFFVESVDSDLIELKPLVVKEEIASDKAKTDLAIKLLEEFNIEESEDSIRLIEYLTKYKVPLTEENTTKAIKILEKLDDFTSIQDNEKMIFIKDNSHDNNSQLEHKLKLIKNTDIKYFLLANKNDYLEYEDFTPILEELFTDEIQQVDKETMLKLIGFMVKNKLEPTFENIKNLIRLNESPNDFIKEVIKEIIDLVYKYEKATEMKDIELIEKINSMPIKEEQLSDLKGIISKLELVTGQMNKEEITDIKDKIHFLEELNKGLSFVFLPINPDENQLGGLLTLIKEERKKGNPQDKIFIHVNLQTLNLGEIKVNCQLQGNTLNIQIKIKKEDLELFESTEKDLIEKISSIGYSLKKIDYIFESNLGLIDNLESGTNSLYVLNMKV